MSRLLELAAPVLVAQHALITRQQAIRLVGSEAPVRQLLERGVWERIDRGLYGPVGSPMTWRRRLMAACLLAPVGSLASHRAAAHLAGVGGFDDPLPEISIPDGTTFRRSWVITHESGDLQLADAGRIDGIPTTGLARIAVDLGGVVGPERFRHTIRELRHGHGVSSEALLRTYLRHSCQGRTGCGALRDWLDRYLEVSGSPESAAELVVLDAIIDAELPRPVAQHWVVTRSGRYRLDLAYPGQLLAIEIDGRQHDDLDISRADAARTAALEALGWTVIRIRASALATDLPDALRSIRQHLRICR